MRTSGRRRWPSRDRPGASRGGDLPGPGLDGAGQFVDRVRQGSAPKASPPIDDRQADRLAGLLVAEEDEVVGRALADRGRLAMLEASEVQDIIAEVIVERDGLIDKSR